MNAIVTNKGWDYTGIKQGVFGGDTKSCIKGIAWLDEVGTLIEDWGCGTTGAKKLVKKSWYKGIDFTPNDYVDIIADLTETSTFGDCIFIRHVLEHNHEWRKILENAMKSFRKRLVLVIFTPLSKVTHNINEGKDMIPDYSFNISDLVEYFNDYTFRIEKIKSKTQYGVEYIFYIEKS